MTSKMEIGFPKWRQLPDIVKLEIISKSNYETRKSLRASSTEERDLVDLFPYLEEIPVKIKFSSGTYYYSYGKSLDEKLFNTSSEANEYISKRIKSADRVDVLKIELEGKCELKLRSDNKPVLVKIVDLSFTGDYESGTEEMFGYIFNQVGLGSFEVAKLTLDKNKVNQDVMSNAFFELEKTILNLRCFIFDGAMTAPQIFGLRAYNLRLMDSSLITPAGFLEYIQRSLLQPSPNRRRLLNQITEDLEMFIFGKTIEHMAEITLNTVVPNIRMCIIFCRYNSLSRDFSHALYISVCDSNKTPRDNVPTITRYPGLLRFLHLISEALPPRFNLWSGQ